MNLNTTTLYLGRLPGFSTEIWDKHQDPVAMGFWPTNHLRAHKKVIQVHK
jgi:hypothetical protein